MKSGFFFIFFLVVSSSLSSQVFLNLDFEYPNYQKETPRKWHLGGEGYTFSLDSLIKAKGQYSLRISTEKKVGERSFASCTGNLPIDAAKGKHLLFKGKIKTEGIEKGAAVLWCRVDGADGVLAFENMMDRPLTGNTDWMEVTIELEVDPAAKNVNFGGLLAGGGTAWFDTFEVFLDGARYIDATPHTRAPTQDEIRWLAENAVPIKSFNPETEANDDLAVLKEMIGEARIVALGEVTHGSKEIFLMKHRLIRYLMKKMGFDTFSIEANMPEAFKLRDYVLRGTGDPADLIRGMYFWTWRTQEVLDMVEWMKEYTETSRRKIHFTGFDMQYYEGALEELKKLTGEEMEEPLVKMEAVLGDIRRERRSNRGRYSISAEEETLIHDCLKELRTWLNNHLEVRQEKAWGLQNVRIIEQYVDFSDFFKRDRYMAENVAWIADRSPESKLVLWAHNGHVQESDTRMGQHLDRLFGEDYLSIGFAFHEGDYKAWGDNGLSVYRAEPSYPGTYEYYFQSAGEPIFILDLREVSREDPASRWVFENLAFRVTGAVPITDEFRETALYDDFDLIIFIHTSSPTEDLGD